MTVFHRHWLSAGPRSLFVFFLNMVAGCRLFVCNWLSSSSPTSVCSSLKINCLIILFCVICQQNVHVRDMKIVDFRQSLKPAFAFFLRKSGCERGLMLSKNKFPARNDYVFQKNGRWLQTFCLQLAIKLVSDERM